MTFIDQMTSFMEACTGEEQRAVIRFLGVSDVLKLKEMAFYDINSLEMNAGYIISIWRRSEPAKSGDILPRQNQRSSIELRQLEN